MNDLNIKYLLHEIRNAIQIDQFTNQYKCIETTVNYADAVYLNGNYTNIFAGIESDIIIIDKICPGIAAVLWCAHFNNLTAISIKNNIIKLSSPLPEKNLNTFQPIIYLKTLNFHFTYNSPVDILCSL